MAAARGHLAVLLTALTLTACNDIGRQKSSAITAARRFQELYNDGSCGQIYDQASPYFQTHETRFRWLQDCTGLRTRLGLWSAFTPESNNNYLFGQIGIVWVRGTARFANGTADLRLDWDLANDRVALNNVLIDMGGEQTSIPGFTGAIRN